MSKELSYRAASIVHTDYVKALELDDWIDFINECDNLDSFEQLSSINQKIMVKSEEELKAKKNVDSR